MGAQFQLELFKSKKHQLGSVKKQKYQNFFGFIRIHEKTLSIIIILFITSLVSFSLGVEKGRRLVNVTKKEEGSITQKQPKKGQAQPKKPQTDQKILATRLRDKKVISKYTIQVATFRTKTYAQKEATRLQKRGIRALIIPGDKYVYVCVGNFPERQDARVTLNQLKKTYHDCFIRRL